MLLHLDICNDPFQRGRAVCVLHLGEDNISGLFIHAPGGSTVFRQRIAARDGSRLSGLLVFYIGAAKHAGAQHIDQSRRQGVDNGHSGGAVPRYPLLHLHGGRQAKVHGILTIVQIEEFLLCRIIRVGVTRPLAHAVVDEGLVAHQIQRIAIVRSTGAAGKDSFACIRRFRKEIRDLFPVRLGTSGVCRALHPRHLRKVCFTVVQHRYHRFLIIQFNPFHPPGGNGGLRNMSDQLGGRLYLKKCNVIVHYYSIHCIVRITVLGQNTHAGSGCIVGIGILQIFDLCIRLLLVAVPSGSVRFVCIQKLYICFIVVSAASQVAGCQKRLLGIQLQCLIIKLHQSVHCLDCIVRRAIGVP